MPPFDACARESFGVLVPYGAILSLDRIAHVGTHRDGSSRRCNHPGHRRVRGRKRTAINTNRVCAVFFGVQNGCLDVEAIAQQVAFIVNDKTHQNRHAVGGILGAGKHGLQITDRRHRLDQQTVNTSIEQGVRLFARNASDFTILGRVLGKPLNTNRAHRAQQQLRVRLARIVDGTAIDLSYGRRNQILLVEERYISLLTDFGFKRIFGTAMNKDLLICFLNSLFNGRQVVKDVSYLNPEHVGDVYTDRKAIFDVYCEGENGEKFIVEMQNAYQTYFKDRSLFYSTFPIREQAPKGNEWNFKLNHVYTVALLNFNMNEDAFDKEKIRHHVQLCDTATHKVFYDKLEFIYVEIAKFNKTLEELETLYDKWLYALKNLYKLTQRPKELCDKVFDRLFEEAEIAKFTPQEVREYEASKKAYRDIKNSIDTAKNQGKEEGLAEGIEIGKKEGRKEGRIEANTETAQRLLAMGLSAEQVAEATQLPLNIIEKLSKS